MFGSSTALKTLQLENAQMRRQIDELRKMIEEAQARFDELPMVIEAQVDEGIRNIDLSDEIESAVHDLMRNATVSIDF